MKYVHVPGELRLSEIRAENACFAPGKYVQFTPPSKSKATNFVSLDKLLILSDSTVKIHKADWYNYAEIGDIDVTTGGICFHKMRGYQLPGKKLLRVSPGDVLISTVRTYRKGIGYVSSKAPNLVATNAIMNVCGVTDFVPNLTFLYVYSFLRSDFFVEQVWAMLNRGMYPRVDRGALDKISIPATCDPLVIQYISAIMQAIIEKEREIWQRDSQIDFKITQEIKSNQNSRNKFVFNLPTLKEIKATGRLDTGLYEYKFKRTMFEILNYKYGTGQLADFNLVSRRGPNLAVSVSGQGIYREADAPPHYYRLILPEHISEVRTVTKEMWFGNYRNLGQLQYGDILFSARGNMGRTIILVEDIGKATTNFDGIMINSSDKLCLQVNIVTGLMLDYYRRIGVLEAIGHGSGAASFTSAHIEDIPFPRFPDDKQAEIAQLYHNPVSPPEKMLTLDNFVNWHKEWNRHLGIWELDREMKTLQLILREVQEQIIKGRTVKVPF